MATINWDAIELLPRFDCCVCAGHSVPWGRSLDNRYFCSKRCSDAHDAGHHAVSRARTGAGVDRRHFAVCAPAGSANDTSHAAVPMAA